MEQVSNRTKNTSFSTDDYTFKLARCLAVLENISMSQLVDRALRKEVEFLLKKHRENQEIIALLPETKEAIVS
jgi:hypothetical protein